MNEENLNPPSFYQDDDETQDELQSFTPCDDMDEATVIVASYCEDMAVLPEHFIKLYSAFRTDLATFNKVLYEMEKIYNPPMTQKEAAELVNSWKNR